MGIYLLPGILAEFRTRYPAADLVVRVDTRHKVVEMVLRGELDLAVIGEGAPESDERLATKSIARDRPGADRAAAASARRNRRRRRPEVLAELPFVSPAPDSASAETLFQQLHAAA